MPFYFNVGLGFFSNRVMHGPFISGCCIWYILLVGAEPIWYIGGTVRLAVAPVILCCTKEGMNRCDILFWVGQ